MEIEDYSMDLMLFQYLPQALLKLCTYVQTLSSLLRSVQSTWPFSGSSRSGMQRIREHIGASVLHSPTASSPSSSRQVDCGAPFKKKPSLQTKLKKKKNLKISSTIKASRKSKKIFDSKLLKINLNWCWWVVVISSGT